MASERPGDEDASGGGERPEGRDAYLRWLRENLGVELDDRLRTRYDAVVNKVRRDFEGSAFWQEVSAGLGDYDGAYRLGAQGYPLFLDGGRVPAIQVKSFDSYVLKTYRRNVSENGLWPDPPEDGWIAPDADGFGRLNDLVRTSFVVKYLDGVEFLAERLRERCAARGIESTLDFEARTEGHYAAHLGLRDEFEIPSRQWDTEAVSIAVEIQITTQLQEVINRLTHEYYEKRRAQPVQGRANWQWDYESDEFTANYLGHILHYVEGMIMEVRARQRDNEKGGSSW